MFLFIALIIALPIAYLGMRQWLADFAYRIFIVDNVFLLTGSFVAIVTGGTIAYHSVKAARMDPVKSLRDE